VATVRYYNEKQIQQRASDPQVHTNPLLTFGDVDIVQHSNCGDIGAVLERRRSERFYISDNSIVTFKVRSPGLTLSMTNTGVLMGCKVEGVLYRVHRHYFRSEPSVLADMFAGFPPQSVEVNGKEELEGTTDESAIEVVGVTSTEFDALLRFFYSS